MVDVAVGCPFEASIDEVFVLTFDMLCLSKLLSFVAFRDLIGTLSCELSPFFSTLPTWLTAFAFMLGFSSTCLPLASAANAATPSPLAGPLFELPPSSTEL